MGEIKNTQGATSGEVRALAEGDDALASSSLRDGDPSRICPNPTLYDSGSCCGTCPDIEPQNDPSRNPQDEINFDSFGRPARRKLATAVRYFMAQLRQSYFGEEHGAPAVMDGPTAAMPRGCWFDDESGRLLKALKPAQAIEARQGGDAEGGSVADKSAVAVGDVPASKSEDQSPSSTPGEVERLVDALKPFAKAADRYDPVEGDDGHHLWADDGLRVGHLRAARTALLSHISTAGRGEGAAPDWIVEFVRAAANTVAQATLPGSALREVAERAFAWAVIEGQALSAADATNPQDQE